MAKRRKPRAISRHLRDLAALDLVEMSQHPGVEGRQNQYRLTGYRTGWAPMVDIDDTDTEDEP